MGNKDYRHSLKVVGCKADGYNVDPEQDAAHPMMMALGQKLYEENSTGYVAHIVATKGLDCPPFWGSILC